MNKLHPRNPHQGRYDLKTLSKVVPELTQHLRLNPRGEQTIDFSCEQAVLCLNKALLAHYYQVHNWQIPKGYLCPPIPGRADYIHYLADLLARSHGGKPPRGKQVKALDIGTGANLIYPIIGSQSYGWQFVATDIDPVSVASAKAIAQSNPGLSKLVKVQQQMDKRAIFKEVINAKSRFDVTLCNPPFHASLAEAEAGSLRKVRNLDKSGKLPDKAKLNFGGQKAELWCPGGELKFITSMANESVQFAEQVCWFTSLVSDGDHIRPLKKRLAKLGAVQVDVISMRQGQKISRLIAWSFLSPEAQRNWAEQS